jgi:hypothetical protein
LSDVSFSDLIYNPPATPTLEPLVFVPDVSASLLDEVGGVNQWLGGAGADYNKLTLDPQKQQASIFAPDVIRKTNFLFTDAIVYQPLLDMLTSTGGYREYQANNNPARRTTTGCDLAQKSANPTLFVFAYDWRKDNAENAVALKDYIGCVQKFYPNAKEAAINDGAKYDSTKCP